MAKKISDEQQKRLYEVLFNAILLEISIEGLFPEYKMRITDSDYRGVKSVLDRIQENVRELLADNAKVEEEMIKRFREELARDRAKREEV